MEACIHQPANPANTGDPAISHGAVNPGWFIDDQNPNEHLDGGSTSSDTRNELMAGTLFRSGVIESSGLGMRMIHGLCADAGVEVAYEKASFGTMPALRRPDPYGENPVEQVRNVRERFDDGLPETESAATGFTGRGPAPRRPRTPRRP